MTNINKLLTIGNLSKQAKSFVALILVVFCVNMCMPQIARAQVSAAEPVELAWESGTPTDLISAAYFTYEEPVVVKKYKVVATAYSSDPWQTDDTPCITANGHDVCKANKENVIAANFLKFGTKVRIPSLYGDKIFYVYDRMNVKYSTRIDFWKKGTQAARDFGVKYIEIEIVQ